MEKSKQTIIEELKKEKAAILKQLSENDDFPYNDFTVRPTGKKVFEARGSANDIPHIFVYQEPDTYVFYSYREEEKDYDDSYRIKDKDGINSELLDFLHDKSSGSWEILNNDGGFVI